jgi:hypothetical protein
MQEVLRSSLLVMREISERASLIKLARLYANRWRVFTADKRGPPPVYLRNGGGPHPEVEVVRRPSSSVKTSRVRNSLRRSMPAYPSYGTLPGKRPLKINDFNGILLPQGEKEEGRAIDHATIGASSAVRMSAFACAISTSSANFAIGTGGETR